MQKQLLTPDQKRQIAQAMNTALDKVTMSWTNELRHWYAYAIKSLDFTNTRELNMEQHRFIELFASDAYGLNMNVVAMLLNSVETRTPAEMGVTARDWADVLILNNNVFMRWMVLKEPVEKKVIKEFEIMMNKPGIITNAN